MARKRLGLIVNPIAGIGGRVGLKGSDGLETQRMARQLGAEPLAQERAAAALERFSLDNTGIELLAGAGEMGESIALRCGLDPRPLPHLADRANSTTAEDTRHVARSMVNEGADLILFAGGDGTARDMFASIGNEVPVLGIPAGVKIHSAVFAISARHAGELAIGFLRGRRTRLREAEVIDLDEAAYRRGEIVTETFGYLTIPYRRNHVQGQKIPTPAAESAQAEAIAAAVVERMVPGKGYLLGPGTTTRAVAELLGFSKTLVGVDLITSEDLLALDVGEQQILEILSQRPLGIIVTPTGGQGFLLGRGNQQISPEVIRLVGRDNILVINLASKIAALRGRPLLVDTGDPSTDRLLSGHIELITGYRERIIYRVSGG